MGPIIAIVIIITAFSLYDYYTTKSWQLITSSERNDTVFENRNKKYGAYQIRTDYNKRILLILFFVTAGIGGLWGMKHVFGKSNTILENEKITKEWIIDLFDDKKIDEPEVPEIPDEMPAQQATAQSIAFIAPTVTDDPAKETPIAIVDPTTTVSTTTQTGTGTDPFNPNLANPGKGGEGNGIEVQNSTIPEVVDEIAVFPGGMAALHKYISENIDLSIVDGTSKINLKFVVDTDGNISNIEVTRNTEKCKSCERAAIKVVESMPKWKPGRNNGVPVKSYFRLPITIQ
jgi:protein TonB